MPSEKLKILCGKPRGSKSVDFVTAAEWDRLLSGFCVKAQRHAANLAAHGWSVGVDGDRCLIFSPFDTDHHWISAEGTWTAATQEEVDAALDLLAAHVEPEKRRKEAKCQST